MKSNIYFLLLLLVIFSLGVMDTFSTIIAMSDSSCGYESNAFYNFVYANSGILSFVALKFIVTTGIALVAFLVQKICSDLKILYVCISVGLIVVGILVTASNLVIAMGGQNITILSMDTYQYSLFCMVAFLFLGFIFTALNRMIIDTQKPGRALYRDQFGMWVPYDDK